MAENTTIVLQQSPHPHSEALPETAGRYWLSFQSLSASMTMPVITMPLEANAVELYVTTADCVGQAFRRLN